MDEGGIPMAKGKIKKKKKAGPNDRLKNEIARELGLGEKIRKNGWGGLTAAETGRVGGILTTRKKAKKAESPQNKSDRV
jgi:hypothetical protein